MKTIRPFLIALTLILGFSSCSDSEDDPIIIDDNPLSDYVMLTAIVSNTHSVEIYSEAQQAFTVGYNELFLRIKDESSDTYISNADISWKPMMHMTEMMHSCPTSSISVTENASVYKGYAVFQMPGNSEEYWEMEVEFTIDGQSYYVSEHIEVTAPTDGNQRVSVFMGSDETRYVLAMMPLEPEVAVNDIAAMLFKMENMISFPIVENYRVNIDPRMPGMGNHSSPNNEPLVYDAESKSYQGKLSLTMTGYWKINMILKNESSEVIKGEEVTDDNESSSLYFELEF
ncbi:hypothetical protein [Flagellimonas algicola]|uniref:YtkA-like protein n=1 Tax=Flagellimonas algicola TaxID=2583815 RepID=A0ABY2WN96_9FLAO|nr:hypothetical protein [Allomuricauda algicola]TMU56461.1 hypothetical protein FGG15_02680 [Allomuricauda algicola]